MECLAPPSSHGGMVAPMATEPSPHCPLCGALVSTLEGLCIRAPPTHWPDGSCPLGGEKLQRAVSHSPLPAEDGAGCSLGSFPDPPAIAGLPSASPGCLSKGSPEKKSECFKSTQVNPMPSWGDILKKAATKENCVFCQRDLLPTAYLHLSSEYDLNHHCAAFLVWRGLGPKMTAQT